MKLVAYSTKDLRQSWGILQDEMIVDIPQRAASHGHSAPADIKELLEREGTAWASKINDLGGHKGSNDTLPAREAKLHAPLKNAGKILAVGRNYRDHAEEADIQLPTWPKLFTKFNSTVIGPGESIIRPTMTEQLDFEVELAAVIGTTARQVGVESAMDHVAGYTITNDVSARDIQFADEQLTLGKNFQTFCPMGPAITTVDELPDPADIALGLRLNGEIMQQSSTRYLIFSIPYLVAFASFVMTLDPGDVILTGTPSGVGCFRDPPVWLEPGDVVECFVDGIGTLENPVVAGVGAAPRLSL